MTVALCHRCPHVLLAMNLDDSKSLTMKGCAKDSRISSFEDAQMKCPLLKVVEVNAAPKCLWLTPAEWCVLFGVEVVDPDGWRGTDGPAWEHPITLEGFAKRFVCSTVRILNSQKYQALRAFLA